MRCVYVDGSKKILEYSDSLDLFGIVEIYANNLELTEWNVKLPEGLQVFWIDNNKLTEWNVKLPEGLQIFWINNNELTEWNMKLPEGLQIFRINNNELQWVCEGVKIKTVCKKESVTYHVPSLLSLCCDIVDPPEYVNIKRNICGKFSGYAVRKEEYVVKDECRIRILK